MKMNSLNTPDDIVNELRMTRTRHPLHTLVLVEGKTDESLFTEYKVNRCYLIITTGMEKSLAAIQKVNRYTTLNGIAAIIDPDFWLIEQSDLLYTDNLLFDDTPDLEFMLIMSPALEKVLRHTTDTEYSLRFARSFRKNAIRLGIEIGYFRLLNHRHPEHSLRMNNVTFAETIEGGQHEFNESRIAELLTRGSNISADELLSQIAKLRQEIEPQAALCNGKDGVALLAHLLSSDRSISEKVKIQTKANELSRTLRIAYEFSYLMATQLYSRIRSWESTNEPYKILKPEI